MQGFKQLACIINPYAGGRREISTAARKLLSLLKEEFTLCSILTTDREGRELSCVKDIIGIQPDCCVIFGGDGTINKVINAYLKLSPERIPVFAVYPSGSGNDFSRSLNISSSPDKFLRQLKNPSIQKVNIGRVLYEKAGEKLWFINSIGMGLDAEVVHHVNAMEQHSGFSYFKSIRKAMKAFSFPVMNITIKKPEEIKISQNGTFAMICNGAYAGGGMRFAPMARIDDNLFNLIFVKKASKPFILLHLPSLYAGLHIHSPYVAYHAASEFTFNNPDLLVQADGEIIGNADCNIKVSEKKLSFIRH